MFYPAVKASFESYCKPSDAPAARLAGAERFVNDFRSHLGLGVNEFGRPTRRRTVESGGSTQPAINPSEWSLKGLAECLCGYEWVENLNRGAGFDYATFVGAQPQSMRNGFAGAFEAGGGVGNTAMVPGNFPHVTAYLGAIAGMVEAAVLERYERPEYIIDRLIETVPSRQRTQKAFGLTGWGDQAMRRNPGDPHKFAQLSDRYSQTVETYNDALAASVTFEAVFFDETGRVIEEMNNLGDSLALRKELDGFKLIAGIVNPYNYNGVAYNTYLTSGNWINDITSNALTDYTNLNVVRSTAARMTDPSTGIRIAISYDTLLVSPNKVETVNYIMRATSVENQNAGNTMRWTTPFQGPRYEPVASVYLDYLLTLPTAQGGLGLAQSAADTYWWLMKAGRGGAFFRVENWPLQINRATPQEYTMLNHKLLLAIFTDQMHSFNVRDPRFVIRSRT